MLQIILLDAEIDCFQLCEITFTTKPFLIYAPKRDIANCQMGIKYPLSMAEFGQYRGRMVLKSLSLSN